MRAIQIKAMHKTVLHNVFRKSRISETTSYIRGSFVGPDSRYEELLKAEQILNELTDIRFHFNILD